jgi:hypothetical protein
MDPKEFYKVYKATKLHFTQKKFNLFKQNAVAGEYEFDNQNDSRLMIPLANILTGKADAAKTCIANFSNYDYWLTHDFSKIKKYRTIWDAYRKKPQETFRADLETLRGSIDKPIQDFITPTKSGNHPPIIQMWMNEIVTADFLCTVDKVFPFIEEYDEFWYRESKAKIRLTKNKMFVKLDTGTITSLVSEIFQ